MPTRDNLPSKLTDDSIVEAIFEIRFSTSSIEELVVGRMARWADDNFNEISPARTGAADIPAPIRDNDENLRFQSLLEISAKGPEGGARKIRIGGKSFSHITKDRYCGWDNWRSELKDAVKKLYSEVDDLAVVRLGLRYINALTHDRHFVMGPESLDIAIEISGKKIAKGLNLNVVELVGPEHRVLYRVSDAGFWIRPDSDSTTLIVDIDVATPEGVAPKNEKQVLDWLELAHKHEKRAFFGMLPSDLIDRLEER